MKTIAFVLLGIIPLPLQASVAIWTEAGRKVEREQVHLWEDNFAKIAIKAGQEKMDFLTAGLREMGYWKSFENHNPDVDKVFALIQTELLSVPGHSQYFADALEEERSKLKPGEYTGSYDDQRCFSIVETLKYLPSPETVKVLGNYLSDNRDFEAAVYPKGTTCPTGGRSSNAGLAVRCFRELGIRNPPVREEYYDVYSKIGTWKLWYEKVQAGTLAFSFIGQKMEYRFKPDGNVESSAIPASVMLLERLSTLTTSIRRSISSVNSLWPWILGGVVAALAAALWFRKKSSRSN